MKRVIGLMSGTSLDGVDAALIETDGVEVSNFGPSRMRRYCGDERRVLQAAVTRALDWNFDGEEPDFSDAEEVLLTSHAELVEALLADADLSSDVIDLVGFHGQTVLHRAPTKTNKGRTLQIGNGRALADRLGIDVVSDFRTADVEAGGHGAPLASMYHQALVDQMNVEKPVAVLNLGGVANVTWIADGDAPIAFDTGPASGLIDAWCIDRMGTNFDEGGKLAASGRFDAKALSVLMAHPFFELAPPKSLDRWDFSLEPVLHLSDADGAATLTAFTARSIAASLDQFGQLSRLLVTGGGRHNPVLLDMIAAALGIAPEPVEVIGWRGDFLEAEAFAWLAVRVEAGLPTSLPSTTGVPRATSGGLIARRRSA
jgi:anhydro-N-acetylmuramic acid kinase